MNLIDTLHKKIKTLPTILNIEDEIYFIQNLEKTSENDILLNKEMFIEILEVLQISHQDNGIFETTNENIHIFLNFADWIRKLEDQYHLGIEKYTDGFEVKLHK